MQGYNKQAAIQAIAKRIRETELKKIADNELLSLIDSAITLDFQYMEDNGVLKNGVAGDMYYDDDDAYEYIVDHLIGDEQLSDDQELFIAQFVDAYMDCQQEFLQLSGLLGWD